MRRFWIATTLTLAAVTTQAHAGDDKISETRPVAPFHAIEVEGSAKMIIEAGKAQAVTVSTEPDMMSNITTSVDDKGTLRIRVKNGRLNKGRVMLLISAASLDSLSIDGATETSATGLNAQNFALTLNGSGGVTLAGSCGSATYKLREGGKLEAADFACRTVNIDIKGLGDAAVRASESLTAKQKGIGSIDVYGSPASYSTDKVGIGKIRFHKDGE